MERGVDRAFWGEGTLHQSDPFNLYPILRLEVEGIDEGGKPPSIFQKFYPAQGKMW